MGGGKFGMTVLLPAQTVPPHALHYFDAAIYMYKAARLGLIGDMARPMHCKCKVLFSEIDLSINDTHWEGGRGHALVHSCWGSGCE